MKPKVQEAIARLYKPDPLLDQLLADPEQQQRLSPTQKLALARYKGSKEAAEALARSNRGTQQ